MSSRHNGYALRENIIGDLVARNLNAQIIFAVADNINIGNIILLTWRRNFAGFQINDSKGNGTGEGAELFQPATFDTCFQLFGFILCATTSFEIGSTYSSMR